MTELLGFIAGSLVAISVLPQILKSSKTKHTKDISVSWGLISLTGQILWIVYGFMIDSYAILIMSSVTLAMAAWMLALKLRYG